MKVLLDENLPQKLRAHLGMHETFTVAYFGWAGLKNGDLLNAAEGVGIDVFLTGDRALEYQQAIATRRMAVVSLSSNHWRIIRNHIESIKTAIEQTSSGKVVRVDCGVFKRSGRK